jgi:Tfp pilus assembly protein PilP
MYRKSVSLLLVLVCLASVGCGKKDAEVNSFITELNSFTDELVKRVESAPNPAAGTDEAQKYFDSRKADMQEKLNSIKKIDVKQVSEETRKKWTDCFYQNSVKVGQLTAKYGFDPATRPKLQQLTQDFRTLIQ